MRALGKALDAAKISWMCIGGIAVIAHGVRRTTTDIDVTLRGDDVDLDALVRALDRQGIRARVDDAVAFARRTQVLLVEHVPSGVALDISLAWLSFEHEALAAHTTIDFGGVAAPAARPEDLVIYKLFAGRPQDLKDAESLLLMHAKTIDVGRVRRILEQLAELSGDSAVAARVANLPLKRVRKKRS